MKTYNRKEFLKKGALAAAGAGLLAGCGNGDAPVQSGPAVHTGKTYKWKMVTTWPPGFPVLGEGATLLAQWIEEMSGGRIKIKVYGAGELVPAFQVFDAIGSGAADIGSGAAYYWAGKIQAAQFFASVPFGMNAQQVNSWIYSGGGQELWEEIYEPFGLIPMLGGNTGVQMGGWFNREINSVSDFEGLKMRIPGLGGEVLGKMGGNAVSIPGGEIYTSLETGGIDATEWIGPYHDFKMGFADIAKYYYSPGWHEPGTALEIIVSKQKYDALPADLQAIIRTAACRLNLWTLSEFEAQNSRFLQQLLADKKFELRTFSPEVLAEIRKVTHEVIGEITASDPLSKRVYEAYSTFQKTISTWARITEKVYYEGIME